MIHTKSNTTRTRKIAIGLLTLAALSGATSAGMSSPAHAIPAPALAAASEKAASHSSNDIGVIPATRSCPSNSEGIIIKMDDEDGGRWPWSDGNGNRRAGNIGAIKSTSNTEFFFCRVNGSAFHAYRPSGSGVKPYSVLKLGEHCPNGSAEFSKHIDNEDSGNRNDSSGNIWPNSSTANTSLVFCLFAPGSGSTMTKFPDLGYRYNVWSRVQSSGSIHTDDENSGNNNRYYASNALRTTAETMVSSGRNTDMHFRVAR